MSTLEKLESLITTRFVVWSFIIIGAVIYLNSLGGKLFWDAEYEILQNSYIKDWGFLPNYFTQSLGAGAGRGGEYWRPMLLLLYSIEWHIWQAWEVGFHFVNLILHIANAGLLFIILRRLLQPRLVTSHKSQVAFLVSLIFLIHPLQTESVTYITGVADPLATFWMFLSLLFYLKKKLAYSLLFFGFALGTKETSIVFPGILFTVDNLTNGYRKILSRTWPYLAVSFFYLLLRLTVLNFGNFLNVYQEHTAYTDSVFVRFFTFLKTLPIYLELLVYPHNLHPERILSWGTSVLEPEVLVGFTIFIIFLAVGIVMFKKKPEYSLASGLFLIPLFPVSGIIFPANALIYEHWLYIPLIGFFLLIGLLIRDLSQKFKVLTNTLTLTGFAIYSIFLSISTISRNYTYGDPERFYNDILRYNMTSLRVWNNLGMLYADKSDFEKSNSAYKTAISLDPKDQSWPPHHNLANNYKNQGKREDAIAEFNRSLAIDNKAYPSYLGLTQVYLDQKDFKMAVETLNRAIEVFPQDPQLGQYLVLVQRAKK